MTAPSWKRWCAPAGLSLLFAAGAAVAESAAVSASNYRVEDSVEGSIEELVVYGRSLQLIGIADTASEGIVGYDDIRLPPLLRVGELVEAVPGMVATQHSGTGKANQYFLRGFNLDHGTDFFARAGGVPVNMRTHGHGQGYLDLNFIIPEMVETTAYRKGPYHASVGDFSSAGSVDFSFYERLQESLLQGTIGKDDYARGLVAGSVDVGGSGNGVLTGALDAAFYDGPWDIDEDLQQYKLFLSYGFDVAGGRARLSLQGYDGEWNATDQIPRRAVRSGLIDELGFIDPDLGGRTQRYAVTGELDFTRWKLGGYFVDYDFTLYSNFTYLLDDPVDGDEFEQRDDRSQWGLWASGGVDSKLWDRPVRVNWGSDLHYDDIDQVGLYDTVARARIATTRRDSVEQLSVSGYGEAEVFLSQRLRATLGARADYYHWDVSAFRELNGGSGDDSLISPKLNLAYRFGPQLEGYASWGRGFHSNDVRGATIAVDPASGDPASPVDVLVKSNGAELGLRFEQGRRFNATLVGFWLELDSELVFVGDAGATEPNDGSRRLGIEAASFWRPADWLAINASYSYTDAEFKTAQDGGRKIPGAVKSSFVVGANANWTNGWSLSARVRYLGEAPLIEDNSVRSDNSWLLNAGSGYRRGAMEFRLDVFNVLDSDDDDIAYYYASRLPGEPAEGVEDIHFHPLEPRTVRATITYHWQS